MDDESSFFPSGYFGSFAEEINNIDDLIRLVGQKLEFSSNPTSDYIITQNASQNIFDAINI